MEWPGALLGALACLALAAGDASCNWNSGCGPCLPDAIPVDKRKPLNMVGADGTQYKSPFRISSASGWDSVGMFSQIVGILVEEKLGIQTEHTICYSQAQCTLAVAGCTDYNSNNCKMIFSQEEASAAVDAGQKVHNDTLPDIMFFPEGEATRYLSRDFLSGYGINPDTSPIMQLGPSGFVTVGGLYTSEHVKSVIWDQHGVDVRWFDGFASPEARSHMTKPAKIIEDDLVTEFGSFDGCESWNPIVETAMSLYRSLGWTCVLDGWWLNPACAAMGDAWNTSCIVIIDMNWLYINQFMPKAVGKSRSPVAQRMISWWGWYSVLKAKRYNATFHYWRPDATHPPHEITRFAFAEEDESNPWIVLKIAWGNALQANVKLRNFLSESRFKEQTMRALMTTVGKTPRQGWKSLYWNMSCDWIRQHEEEWSQWLPSAKSCSLGQYFDEKEQACLPCPVGTEGSAYRNGTLYCRACSPGKVASLPGQLDCEACAPGSFSNVEGRSECTLCAIGHKQPLLGQTSCSTCEAGGVAGTQGSSACMSCGPGFAAPTGSEWCVACEAGKFSNESGSASCTSCAPGLVTEGRGANQASDCICPRDYFRPLRGGDGSACEPCPAYMDCKAGSDLAAFAAGDSSRLSLVPGYMTTRDEPNQVYLCMPLTACPGGGPGSCASFRDPTVVACGRGLPGTYATGESYEECSDSGTDGLIFVLICILGSACLLVFGCVVSKDPASQTMDGVRLMIVGGICITGFQTLGVLDSLSFAWFEPLRSLFQVVAMAAMDFKYLRLGCAALNTPTSVYAVRQLIAPVTVPGLFCILLAKRHMGYSVDVGPETVNAVGNTFAIFFPAVVISCVVPFICYEHPLGGKQSMVSEPSVLCFEGEAHEPFVWLAIIGLLVVACPYLALSIYGTVKHKAMLASYLYEDTRMLRAFRFLFARYTPECHYYGLLLSVRSLAICLVPVIPGLRHDSPMQICVLSLILSFFLVLQQWLKPWKAQIANLADGLLMTLCLQLLVVAAVSAATLRPVFGHGSAVHVFGTVIFVLFVVLALVAVILCIHRLMVVNPFYTHFICHHKGGAAAQARLMKIILQEKMSARVFIDSDDLRELDVLFDIVKCRVGTLVIYLTRETLRRPWCAGEVCTALSCNVKAVAVKTEGWIPPKEEELMDMEQYLDCQDVNLSQYGIELANIAKAYRHLMSEDMPQIELPRGKSTTRWREAVDLLNGVRHVESPTSKWGKSLARDPKIAGAVSMTPIPSSPTSGYTESGGLLVVSSEPGDDEACAASLVILHKINQHIVRMARPTGVCSLCDLDSSEEILETAAHATCGVVLLTSGSLSSMQQVSVIVELMARSVADVIPVKTPGFQFPNDVYFTRDLPAFWSGDASLAEHHMRAFFRKIAISLDIAGSDAILQREVDDIFARSVDHGHSMKGMSTTKSTPSMKERYSEPPPMPGSAWVPPAASEPPCPAIAKKDSLDRI